MRINPYRFQPPLSSAFSQPAGSTFGGDPMTQDTFAMVQQTMQLLVQFIQAQLIMALMRPFDLGGLGLGQARNAGQLGGRGFTQRRRSGGWSPTGPSTTGGADQVFATPTAGAPGNMRASVERVLNKGARTQRIDGRITVNGNTYSYRSGGYARGSLPMGTYTVTPHLYSRNTSGMTQGGVGYSFALSNKYDRRVGDTRSALRIHPDGNGAGTAGCIGIVGGAATQKQFRKDMYAEIRRNGGRAKLLVG